MLQDLDASVTVRDIALQSASCRLPLYENFTNTVKRDALIVPTRLPEAIMPSKHS